MPKRDALLAPSLGLEVQSPKQRKFWKVMLGLIRMIERGWITSIEINGDDLHRRATITWHYRRKEG